MEQWLNIFYLTQFYLNFISTAFENGKQVVTTLKGIKILMNYLWIYCIHNNKDHTAAYTNVNIVNILVSWENLSSSKRSST